MPHHLRRGDPFDFRDRLLQRLSHMREDLTDALRRVKVWWRYLCHGSLLSEQHVPLSSIVVDHNGPVRTAPVRGALHDCAQHPSLRRALRADARLIQSLGQCGWYLCVGREHLDPLAPWAQERPARHSSGPAVRSLGWMLVVVDVRLTGVMLILFLAAVVMAVGERSVIMLMRVP